MDQYTAPKRILANHCVRGLCLSQFTALVGTFALFFASMALVEEITQSSTQVGLMIFSSTLPGFLFGARPRQGARLLPLLSDRGVWGF